MWGNAEDEGKAVVAEQQTTRLRAYASQLPLALKPYRPR